MRKSQEHYDDLNISNRDIIDFLDNYATYLGTTATDNEAVGLVNMLYSLSNSLFILSEDDEYAHEISQRVGDTLGDLVWDSINFAMDLTSALSKTNEKMQSGLAKKMYNWDAKNIEAAKKLGMNQEGNLRQAIFLNGELKQQGTGELK